MLKHARFIHITPMLVVKVIHKSVVDSVKLCIYYIALNEKFDEAKVVTRSRKSKKNKEHRSQEKMTK